jgi:heat shock protein HtpX
MTSASPTILALETDSAWVIILVSSAVVLAATIVAARVIGRPGGLASGLLLALPLALPLVAALAFAHAALPEAAVLRPAGDVLLDRTGGLLDLLVLENHQNHTLTPYAVSRSAGSWLLIIGVLASSFMLLRRLIGAVVIRSLLRRCSPPSEHVGLEGVIQGLCIDLQLRRVPELLVLPPAIGGAFVVGLRHPRILLAGELLESLDRDEIEGVLAHELAHLRARDVELVLVAGLLRDLAAWNPFAHLAYGRLRRNRELEADRAALAATGKPLAVASGLLKVAETMLRTSRRQRSTALAFLGTKRLVTTRVSQLLAVADGRAQVRPARHLPFLAAACVTAAMGLQVAAQIAEREAPALAFVWGTPASEPESLWAPKRYRSNHQPNVGRHSVAPGKRLGEVDQRRRPRYPQLAGDVSVQPRHLDEWVTAMDEWTHELGVSPVTLRWEARRSWEAVPLVTPVGDGPLGIYEVKLGLAEATR